MNRYLNNPIRSLFRPFILAGCLFLVQSARCQQFLSIDDAIKEGIKNNYGVTVAKNDLAIAGNNVNYGNAGFLPIVSAYGTYDKSSLDAKVKVVSGAELNQSAAPGTLTTAGLQAQWVLFDGQAAMLNYKKLKGLRSLGELEMKRVMENTIAGITTAYYDIVRQKLLLQACQKRLDISDFRLFLSTERKKEGSGSELELLQAGVRRQADTAAYTLQFSSLNAAMIRLNQIMTTDLQQQYQTSDTINLSVIPELKALIKNCLELNKELKSREEILQLSQLDIQSIEGNQYPRLILRGAYGYYENETDAAFIKYNRMVGPQIGISAGLTLFDGLKLRQKISNAKLLRDNQDIRKKEEEQNLVAALMQTYNDYESQAEVVVLNKEALTMADKNMKISRDAYQVGAISSLQFREAQEDLFQASANLVDALYKTKCKETELLRLSGVLVK